MNKDITLEDLGYILMLKNDEDVIYRNKTDYIDYTVSFELKNKTYQIWFINWYENKGKDWIPMEQRKTEWLKHCSAYGHWQKVDYPISMDLHQAINNKCKELGWLDETI